MPDTPPPAQPLELTVADILAAGLNDLLGAASTHDAGEMYSLLSRAARDADAAGEALRARALGFMAAIASMMLEPDTRAAPFQPLARWADGTRTMLPEDLSTAQVDLLVQLVDVVSNPLLRARLADLVWLKDRRKGVEFAHAAIDGYRIHAIDFDTWHLSGRAVLHRALQLAASIGGGAGDRTADIEAVLLAAFDRASGAGTFEPLFYVRPLYVEKRAVAQAPRIAGELERVGRERLAAGCSADAEGFLDEAGKWYERARLSEKQTEMQALIGASLAAQADASPSAIARQEFLTRAIKAYRDVPGPHRAAHGVEDIIADLRAKLAAAGRLALGEMRVAQGPRINLTDAVREAVRRVQGKTLLKALLAFCTLQPFPRRDELVQDAQALLAQSFVGRLFGGVTFAGDGRAVARRAGADSGLEAEAAQVESRAIRGCCDMVAMTAYGMIRPALEAMQLECYLTPLDFEHLAGNAGIVPRDRADVVAKGLYAGYCGDYVQSIHILVPQFEHMVRVALQDAGAQTTTHDANGLDMEIGLSNLVERPQMTEVFGEDLTFTVRSLMCEQEGPNLRNAVAHGMADSALCNSVHGVYAWWLVLRLVVTSFVTNLPEEQERAPATRERGA
ncbi:DUF4209 domain-containing protein [Massilia sp. 9096]|uniref:DUF4209 domain-containing protein n=1 Tax=Massilia sp. 9096 TaxID=1500894 RepID=UPI00055FDCE8|nr:DUF4209 domain-containing protein [Massilia sp. 9096]